MPNCGPIFGAQSASGILSDFASQIESGKVMFDVGPDDAKAIRWALECVEVLRKIKPWQHAVAQTFIEEALSDGAQA